MGKIGLFDLEKNFAFYGAYHSNKVNIAIHMLFVWPILFTILLLLDFTPSLFNLKLCLFGIIQLILLFNIGFLLTVIYAVFYVCFDLRAGSLAAFLCFLCWFVSSFLSTRIGFSLAWKVKFISVLFQPDFFLSLNWIFVWASCVRTSGFYFYVSFLIQW